MKKYALYISFIFFTRISFAQTIEATGTVKNEQHQPVSSAFISDQKTRAATYSDSAGVFKLDVPANSILTITCNGYKSTSTKIDNANNVNVVLAVDKLTTADKALSFNNSDNSLFESHTQTIDVLAMLSPKSNSGGVQGSRYLFNDWMHGYVIDKNGAIIQNDHYLFNYDKVGGGLLMTSNKTTAIEINRDQVTSFTLFDKTSTPVVFENVSTISNNHYVEVIAEGKNVKIYKDVGTVFERANFSTNGLMSTGHNYDAYIEKSNYYFIVKAQGSPQKLILKKKALKAAFPDQSEKVNKFTSDNNDMEIDDKYLQALGNYLNR